MEYIGKVQGGVIVLDESQAIADGTIVRVQALGQANALLKFAEYFQDIEGKAVGLPENMAENHDYYLHGLPKQIDQ